MGGGFKKEIPFLFTVLPSNQSILFRKKGLPPVKVFSFFVKFTAVHIFPAVSPQRGPTSKTQCASKAEGASVLFYPFFCWISEMEGGCEK